jgi:predicted PurR-regulated permease PerM
MDWVNTNLDIRNMDSTSLQTLLPNVWNVVSSVSAGLVKVVTFLKNVIIGFIVAIYLLAMKKVLCGQMKRMVYAVCSKKVANIIIEHCRYAHKVMSGFISGKVLDSIIIGVICFVGTSILNIPYALLVSVIIGLTNIIPFFGPFIGAVPCALFILLNSPVKCLVFIVFIVLLQQFDGNILGPKILGESTGLSSFWVIFALLLFGGLFGVVGMLIGVPVFAVFYHIVDDATRALLRKKGMSVDTKDYILLEKVEGDQYIKLKDPAFKEDSGSNQQEAEAPSEEDESDDTRE